MKKNKLIVKLLLKIEGFKANSKVNEAIKDKLESKFTCIDAPLNDNKLQFNDKQLKFLIETLDEIQQIR